MDGMEKAYMEGIGNVIFEMREKAGIYQQDLCRGLCSCSTLSRLEWEGRNTSIWLVDAFLQRLGKSQDNFWTIVHMDDFQIMEYRRLIWENLVKENYEEAGRFIAEYEEKAEFNKNLHMQFILQAKSYMSGYGDSDWKKAEELSREAIGLTVEGYEEAQTLKCLVGREELEVLLLLAEAKARNGKIAEAEKLVQDLMQNMENKEWEEEELVKIYPKVLRYYVEFLKDRGKYKEVRYYARKAVDMLAGNGILYLLAEFLELICWSMEQEREEEQRDFSAEEEAVYGEQKKQAEILADIWVEYGAFSPEKMIYCTNIQKDISLSSEIIYKCRKICGMSQRELAGDVCTTECLSRIENGRSSPQEKKYRGLMEKMNWVQDRNLYFINAREYELHEQLREVNRCLSRLEYQKGMEEWEKIRVKIPTDTLNNQQCIQRYDTALAYNTGAIDVEEAIERYNRALELTIPDWKNVDIAEWPLSRNEIFLISNLLEAYQNKESLKKIVLLKRKLKESMENSQLCNLYFFVAYGMVLYNLAGTEFDLGNIDAACEIVEKGLGGCVRNGRCNMIPYFYLIKAEVLNEKDFKKNQEKAYKILEDNLCLSDLLKMPEMKKYVLEYEEENWESK